MDNADDCFDAWDCDPADELLDSCPGEEDAFAAVAGELLRDAWSESAAWQLEECTTPAATAATPGKRPIESSPRCGTAGSSPASSSAASSSHDSRVVLPVAASSPEASASSAAAESGAELPAKRRRLSGKQARPATFSLPAVTPAFMQGERQSRACPAKAPAVNFGGADDACVQILQQQGMIQLGAQPIREKPPPLSREQRQLVYSLHRRALYKRLAEEAPPGSNGWHSKRTASDAAWKALPDEEKMKMMRSLVAPGQGADGNPEADALAAWLDRKEWLAEVGNTDARHFVRRKYVMGTYFHASWMSCAKRWEALALKSAHEIEEAVKVDPWAKSMMPKMEREVAALVEKVDADFYSASVEACMALLHEKKGLQLHLHVVLEWVRRRNISKSNLSLPVAKVLPQHLTGDSAAAGHRVMTSAPLHYYCQVPKVGQVHTMTNKPAFTAFLVNPRWLNMWIQAGKLDPVPARAEFVKCAVNLTSNLQNLDRLSRERENMLLGAKEETVRLALLGSLGAFKEVPEATEFLEHLKVIRGRYKFLVFYGPSRTGKTSFVRMLTGDPSEVFEVNCASGQEPDLRPFRHFKHKHILFDEATPELVLNQKKLFQAPNCFIQMGASTTNCHAYTVYVSGTGLIVCANTWMERLRCLSPADQEWLESNSFAAHIAEPLFRD